ncbi:Lipase 4 [Colletotrichum sidae]|uniref:Carboxylic ester hydrolase n=1 Tax=Colletotrichum sidae TaxID=1347389 RepID=A0A4R8TB79_9PEZI|nr:Lipase 4 [Colletotrichum sidae]
MKISVTALAAATLLCVSSAAPSHPTPEDPAAVFLSQLISKTKSIGKGCRRCSHSKNDTLTVDLGYTNIRYAAAPTGDLRWQPPQKPASAHFNGTQSATEFGAFCPQAFPAIPGLPILAGDEDCLSLNVWAPANATNLPVLVWIHGGGYGIGFGRQDMSELINDNDKRFVVVVIQYRLGAFGFLSSADVKSRGAVNAGLLGQAFALGWVKEHICKFGGDRKRVTIAGESAGAGSVMYHNLAADGTLGTLLFNNTIAASNYLPYHYKYDAEYPTKRYRAFAEKAGCSASNDTLACLRGKDSMVLQLASANTTSEQIYGRWAFDPVLDDVYLKSLPSQQMTQKRVNGDRILVGNNANEGPTFTPRTINTEADLKTWLQLEFPNFQPSTIEQVLTANPTRTGANASRFETDGLSALTALDVSPEGTGQLQRAINIVGEATFVCPSYWLSSAFTSPKQAWHYQYSVPYAYHGADLEASFGPALPNMGKEFTLAFRRMWGNFIVSNNPSITNEVANGPSSGNVAAENAASKWPVWEEARPLMLNLNQTGGVPFTFTTAWNTNVTGFRAPGQVNNVSLVDAAAWEGGRGWRCDFWRNLAPSIPA